ncbi:LuxR C-terminal-related transcriptional regulator [Bradyrhizobium sp. 18BD]
MLRIRLLIADRRPIVLQGFEPLFAAESDFEIVASCNNGADCLEAVRRLTPDVALVEDGFPDVTASEMLAAVNAEHLPTRLVFYTASIARGDLAAAIAAGACAGIPMREEPETLMQSLRLVAPTADRLAAPKAADGAFGENGLAALTDLERKIMRLVACGMSNKEIARQLKVATGTINAQVDHISAQLEIKNRRGLATFALSRLYGGVGALAALIWAALDDVQSASAGAVDHAYTDTVTVMAADGTGAVVTIKITPQKTAAAPGKTAKVGRVENSVADSPTRAKLVESRADIAASTIALPTPTPPRLGLSSFGTFALMAVGVSIYELLASPAQAFTFSDSPSDFFASDAANATSELAVLNTAGGVDANLNGFDTLAWLNPGIHSESFAFGGARGDIVGRGDELQITGAAASEDSVRGDGTPHVGAGAIDALIDHGGFEQAGGTDAPRNAGYGATQATEVDGSNHAQSQRDLHVSEQGAAAGKPHAEHGSSEHDPTQGQSQRDLHVSEEGATKGKPHAEYGSPEHDPTQGQSQRDVHVSEEGATKGKPHAEHEPPGQEPTQRQSQRDSHVSEEGAAKDKPHAEHGPPEHEPNRGQLHRDVDASKDDATVGKKHVKDDAPGSHANSSQSQPDLHKAHLNASEHLHGGPSENAGGNHQAADDSGPAQTAAAPGLGDSFHFKNDMAEAKHPDHFEDNHGPDTVENGLHNAGNNGLALIQDVNLIAPSHAEQGAIDHAGGVGHHPTHDLLV